MTELQRGWVYRIGLAVLALAVAYGLLADEAQVTAWAALLAAVTGNGLAALNTSIHPEE